MDGVGISWNKSCVVGSMSRILVIAPAHSRERDKSRELRKYAVSELAGSSPLLLFFLLTTRLLFFSRLRERSKLGAKFLGVGRHGCAGCGSELSGGLALECGG